MRGDETPENHLLTILKGFSTVSEGIVIYFNGFCKVKPRLSHHPVRKIGTPTFFCRLEGRLKIDN